MSIKGFFSRQAKRASYLVERALVQVERTADEAGVLPKLPPKKEEKK